MTCELQSTLEASAIQWPDLRNDIPCMVHVILLAIGVFMSSFGVKGHTKSWEAHKSDQQSWENESRDIGKSQRLREGGHARINKVSAMKPGSAKKLERVRISWYFESPELDLHIAQNASCIDYADTWSSKRAHWLSKSQRSHHVPTDYGCEDTVELHTGVAWACLLIMGIHPQVAPKSTIHSLPATFHNSRWVDHSEVCHGSIEAISILDPVDVKEAYCHIASQYHSVQCHVRSYGRCDASFSEEEDSMERRLVLRREVSCTEAVQMLHWCNSNNEYASHFYSNPRSFSEVAIV